jgi:hypothetical protein
MKIWNSLIINRILLKLPSFNQLILVGAEGFEASFPSGHYAVFLVGFNSKTSLHQGLARIL